jgi:hypothetical protein
LCGKKALMVEPKLFGSIKWRPTFNNLHGHGGKKL